MDSPKSNPHPTVGSEIPTDPDTKAESDPDIKADSEETEPRAESDPNSKADFSPDPKAGSIRDTQANPGSSLAVARPWQSDMARDQFIKSLTEFHAERGSDPRLHRQQLRRLTAFNLGPI